MKKCVLFLYQSSNRVCGIGTWLEILDKQLKYLDWDVKVGLAWGRHFHRPEQIEACRPGFNTIWMDGRTGSEEGRIWGIDLAISRTQPAIVILNCIDSGFEAIRRLKKQGSTVRLVATNHGNLAKHAAAIMENRDIVDLAVCVGKKSVECMKHPEFGFPPNRIIHIPNAVPPPTNPPNKSSRPFRIGYAARLDDDPVKRASDIEPYFHLLCKQNTDFELWIAGGGSLEPAVQTLANRYPEQIKFFGPLSRQQLYTEFYPHLDAFINFSTSEAFGLSIAESMAHGVVPITSHFCGLDSEGLLIAGHNSLLFPIGDLEAATLRTLEVMKNRELREELGSNAAKHIAEQFSPTELGKQWSDVLKSLATMPPLPKPRNGSKTKELGSMWSIKAREFLKRCLKKHFPHQSAGEEWPHYQCRSPEILQSIEKYFTH